MVKVSRFFSPTENQRKYLVDGVPYYSVTSVIQATKPMCMSKIIEKWKTNLHLDYPKNKAKNKVKLPVLVGDYTHQMIEKQLLNLNCVEPKFDRSLAKHFKPVINDIEEVIATELPVYSKVHGYAGTVDAIVKFKDGRIVILDHKTASQKKTKSSIKDYNLQIAAYALAYYEMTGIAIDDAQINIIYRSMQGKRNPTRLDRYYVENLRKECCLFLTRLQIFKAQLINNNFDESPW
jgi:hypothetical protein